MLKILKMLRRILCRHFWINILKIGGAVRTKHGDFSFDGTYYVDYFPKCESFRTRHHDR